MRTVIMVPCYNEELTIRDVIAAFRRELPDAEVVVFDNASTDKTAELARDAGAQVFLETRRGKGYVVQSMFERLDADCYVMVDGDHTYPAPAVHALIAPVVSGQADMTVGSRLHQESESSFHFLNRFGNRMFLHLINFIFGAKLTDILSGYRAFSRDFVRRVPLFGGGFEIETELTIKSLQRGLRIVEVPVNLVARPPGSHSKIRILQDGFIILNTILSLLRDYRPLTYFSFLALPLLGAAVATVAAPWLVAAPLSGEAGAMRVPVALALLLLGFLTFAAGLLLHTIARRFQEFEHQFRVLSTEILRATPRFAGTGPGEADAPRPHHP